MKKIGLFILGLCAIFLVGNFTQAKDYEYTNLDITANILIDGTINVKENFTANFFTSKHGIIRDIPLNYSVGGKKFHINVSNMKVQGKNFSSSNNNGNIEIKIGDANKTVIGKQYYPISYSTYGLIKNFSGMGYAELYWNLVGYDFDTNINNVTAELILPKTYTGFTKDDFLITTDGKIKTIDGFAGTVNWSQGNKIIITYDKVLPAHQGITLAIKFPNNYFEFDHKKQAELIGHIGYQQTTQVNKNTSNFKIDDSRALVIAIARLGFIWLILFFIWKGFRYLGSLVTKLYIKIIETEYKSGGFLHGRFAKKYPIIVQYNPPKGLDSAEVGLLLHRRSDGTSLSSLIYKWIGEGLISIKENNGRSKSYTLNVIKKLPISAKRYENSLRYSIFGSKNSAKISEDKNLKIEPCLNVLEYHGCKTGWLKEKKSGKILSKKSIIYLIITLLIVLSFIIPSIRKFTAVLIIITYIFPAFLLLMDVKIPKFKKLKLTEEGAELVSEILGYRKFLKSCDENKLKSFLKQDPLYFDKILPYAIVFGIGTELTEKMHHVIDDLGLEMQINYIEMSDLNDTLSTIARYSTPLESNKELSDFYQGLSYDSDSGFSGGSSFSGGGSSFSSGGGGGGGGGRSW